MWSEAKKVCKEIGFGSNWVEIISYYNTNDGNQVSLFTILDGESKRVIGVTDTGTVLLLNKKEELEEVEYNVVFESNKKFSYSKGNKERTIVFPKGVTIEGNTSVKINLEK